jgi:hypothetical protein
MTAPTTTDVPPETVLRTEAGADGVPADSSAPVAPSTRQDAPLHLTVRFAVQATAVVPVHTAGVVEVVVTRGGGFSSALHELLRPLLGPPVILSLSTHRGPKSGGTQVNINGSGFRSATGVAFGTQPAASFSIQSDSLIVADSPGVPNPCTVDLRVGSPAGPSPICPQDKFTYT